MLSSIHIHQAAGASDDAAMFATLLPEWVLVGPPVEDHGEDGAWSFRTRSVPVLVETSEGTQLVFHATDVVLPLAKRAGTLFPNLVLIGRAGSNDVELQHASISKLHARFELVEGKAFVSDAGSSNGTTIDGRPLVANERRGVRSGAMIVFGRCAFALLARDDLRTMLQRAHARGLDFKAPAGNTGSPSR